MIDFNQFPAFQHDNEQVRSKSSYTILGEDFAPDYSKNRLIVQTGTTVNIIKLARQLPEIYEQYLDIIRHDFILISHHKDGYSVFMKRTEFHPERVAQYKEMRLQRFDNLLFTLTPPPAKRKSPSLPNRLLVLFSHMNGGGSYDSSNAIDRLFVQYFADIQRSLVKNVFVLRVADLNLSHGSYFTNTENFPDYEQQIQKLIQHIMQKYQIDHDNVVLYGGSKGGAGALLHGAIGDYYVVAGDPIIDSGAYNQRDLHFVKHFKPADLTPILLGYMQNNVRKKYIFASQAQKFNFNASNNLAKSSHDLVQIVDLSADSMVSTHPHITAQSVPEQIALINLFFDGAKILASSTAAQEITQRKKTGKRNSKKSA